MSGPQSGWNGNRHTPVPPRTPVPIAEPDKPVDAPERRPLSPRRQSPAGGTAARFMRATSGDMLLLAIAVLPSITALLRPSFGQIAALYHRRRHLATLPIAQPEPHLPGIPNPPTVPANRQSAPLPTVNRHPCQPSFGTPANHHSAPLQTIIPAKAGIRPRNLPLR